MFESIFLAGSYVPTSLGASAADADTGAFLAAMLIFVMGLLVGLEWTQPLRNR